MNREAETDKTLESAVAGALSRLDWRVEHLDGVKIITTASVEPLEFVLSVAGLTAEHAVLDFSCPVLRDPAQIAVLRSVANNGAPWSLFGAGFFSPYLGIDEHVPWRLCQDPVGERLLA
jgi:hypothetical protein